MTTIFSQMEDDLNFFEDDFYLWKMEDDLNIVANGRRTQYFSKWKTTPTFWKMEDDLNYLENRRRPQYLVNGSRTNYLKTEDDLNN